MIRSNAYIYSDTYIHVTGTIEVPSTVAAGASVNDTNKTVLFKSCVLFTN